MRNVVTVALLLLSASLHAQQKPPPILDMHLHALPVADFVRILGRAPVPHCVPMTDYAVPASGTRWREAVQTRELPCDAIWSPATDAEVMQDTLAIMRDRNVIGVTSGSLVGTWTKAAAERIIPSIGYSGRPDSASVDAYRAWFEEGTFVVLGEVTTQYGGLSPDDPSIEPYWALAEELNVPVGIHIGTGPLGAPYLGFSRYRARLHSPLGLEEVLLRHPDLRVYIMHAGWPMLDELLALLWTHPQVYVDIGAIDWALPRAEFHRYLQRIVEAGFGKRVLFGSDQMIWPDAMEIAIRSIESAAFLTPEQKRDIFFNNAARFLRLSPEQIASMQGSPPD